jgi:hypothetical protein
MTKNGRFFMEFPRFYMPYEEQKSQVFKNIYFKIYTFLGSRSSLTLVAPKGKSEDTNTHLFTHAHLTWIMTQL